MLFGSVDVGDDGFYHFSIGVICFHAIFYLGNAVQSGGVITAAKEFSGLFQG